MIQKRRYLVYFFSAASQSKSISDIRKMQSSIESIICFTWREIEAGGFKKSVRHDTAPESDDGEAVYEGSLDDSCNAQANNANDICHGRGQFGPLHVGGELSGSQWMVHGSIPRTMRFSYR